MAKPRVQWINQKKSYVLIHIWCDALHVCNINNSKIKCFHGFVRFEQQKICIKLSIWFKPRIRRVFNLLLYYEQFSFYTVHMHNMIICKWDSTKVSFFHQCSKMQIIPIKKFNIQSYFFQFLWLFRWKCWFQGQIIPRIHLILPNA